jgi:Fe-S oxidoreductase
LLFEMLDGSVLYKGWRSDAVEEALDLCLGCKGCKSDCPVSVDMATYKAEFRSHHYAGRFRPRAAYSMGLIHRWAHLAGHAPWLANFLTQAPGLSAAAKWIGGIAAERRIPRFADEPFTAWHRRNVAANAKAGKRVMLWPDTFNNYFRPATAIAATRVLQSFGYQVLIPGRPLCCGRPLYDWGMLDTAKDLWRLTLKTLEPEIEAGTPIIGLEPACVSAFRDELVGLFRGEERALRLSRQTFFLTEFLDRHCKIQELPHAPAALVQMHCHQHAIIKPQSEKSILEKLGLDHEVMASGCCGMAGSFGFEAEHYDLSRQVGELRLFPALRDEPADTLVAATGVSCRQQIGHFAGRTARHPVVLVAEALAR